MIVSIENWAVPGVVRMKTANKPIRLNLGCGLRTPPDWINVDGSWNARLAKHRNLRRALSALGIVKKDRLEIPWSTDVLIHDIRKPLPFESKCASAVYASHVLEHLYYEEGQRLVGEAFRVLMGGGILRIVVPDLRTIVEEYLKAGAASREDSRSHIPAADVLNQKLLLRWPSPESSGFFYRVYSAWQDFHSHKWMYDLESLGNLLTKAGFEDVQSRGSLDSQIENIDAVEDPSRILSGAGICVEGVKPNESRQNS